MKKNTMMRIAAVVLMCTLVTACFASSTFAKYTSEATGTGVATVAKWDVDINGEKITGTDPVTFDLFKTVLDTKNDAEEENVEKSTTPGTVIIAPGTKGSFDLKVKNNSQVDATYSILLKNTDGKTSDATIPVTFKVTKGSTTTTCTLAELLAGKKLVDNETLRMNNVDNEQTITVEWEWAFESGADAAAIKANDASDTAHGITPTSIYLTAVLDVTQVD